MLHLCQTCGACCGTFRVSFYQGEVLPGPHAVPEALVTQVGPFRVAMRGTERAPVRCEALEGEIGGRCGCSIHPRRPSPCRDFAPSFEDGTRNEACDRARGGYGLAPLRPADWTALASGSG